jgi:hypothetical protein
MKAIKIFSALLVAVFLSGCATMSKEECQHADWYLKGVDDATQGYPLDRVIEHGKACARVNIEPDMKAYRQGHNKGARLYCVPPKGYSEGRNGASYNGICPPDLEEKFLRAYRDGQELYTIEHKISELENQINSNNSQIDSSYSEISRLKRDVVNSNNEQDRRYSMRRIDDLEADIRRLEANSGRAAHEIDLYENDRRIVEEKHVRMGYIQ